MQLWMGLIIISVSLFLMGRGVFRKYVAPEKIRWYDYFVLVILYLLIVAVETWVMHLRQLGHIAYLLGAGWYAVDVIDGRSMPKQGVELGRQYDPSLKL